jgi:hypothetical protein
MKRLLQVSVKFIIEIIGKAEYDRLQRRVYWFEENEMKKTDYDQVKQRNTLLLKAKEKVERDVKELKHHYDMVRFII